MFATSGQTTIHAVELQVGGVDAGVGKNAVF